MSGRELSAYFGVDYYVVWQIAATECPAYRTEIAALPEYVGEK